MMRLIILPLSAVLLMHSAIAAPIGKNTALAKDSVLWSEKNGQITLTVAQASLPLVLQHIAKQYSFPIHISGLPEQLDSSICTGANMPQVLNCLLQNKANIVIRFHRADDKHKANPIIAEAWVMPSGTHHAAQQTLSAGVGTAQSQIFHDTVIAKKSRVDKLLEQAQSHDTQQKAKALSALLTEKNIDDQDVRDVLEQSLTDQNSEVRAQALSTLAHRDSNDALAAIQQGLQDESEDVRLIAVEAIKDDMALLQQMINDQDEAVQSLAEIKLKMLTQQPIDEPNPQ